MGLTNVKYDLRSNIYCLRRLFCENILKKILSKLNFSSPLVELYKCEKCLPFEVANLIKLLYWLETYEPASPKLHFCKWGLIQFAPSSYQTCKWISFVYLDVCLNERNSFCKLNSREGSDRSGLGRRFLPRQWLVGSCNSD